MAGDMKPEGGKPRVWPKVLLAVSLSLNLLVVGAIAGAGWKASKFAGGPDPRQRESLNTGVLPFILALPQDLRRGLRNDMQAALAAARPQPDEQIALTRELLQALRDAPFDAERLGTLMRARQSDFSAQQDIGQRILLDRIRAMSDVERGEYADRVERAFARRHRFIQRRRSGG